MARDEDSMKIEEDARRREALPSRYFGVGNDGDELNDAMSTLQVTAVLLLSIGNGRRLL